MIRRTFLAIALNSMFLSTTAFADSHAKDIIDIAVENGSFKTLVAAVQAADLVEALKGEGPFTVFAPTDEAFAALPQGTVENLLKSENQQKLKSILTYHIIPGKVMSGDIAGKTMEVETAEGSTVIIDSTDGGKIDDANIVTTDIEASNGVIHVIDAVIMP